MRSLPGSSLLDALREGAQDAATFEEIINTFMTRQIRDKPNMQEDQARRLALEKIAYFAVLSDLGEEYMIFMSNGPLPRYAADKPRGSVMKAFESYFNQYQMTAWDLRP